MRSGHADQAEAEFDAALDTLFETSLNGRIRTRLLGTDRLPGLPPAAWLSSLASPPRSGALDPPEPAAAPEEATLEAPALLSPEDVEAVTEGQPDVAAPLPEPDAEKHDIPLVFNDQVKALIQHFQTRKWGVITRGFERASRYLPMMRRVFLEEGLPEDLLNLAFIESAVNPWATSRAKAAGIWQFMPSTGRRYGMRSSGWVDERRDPEKSTRAAARYLKRLYQMFESWPLALAAYNAGEGKIERAIRRQRTRDFWTLRLPRETRLFVPAFMAMTIISREPERYGFSPPPEAPHQFETVSLRHPTDLSILAQAAGTSVEEIRRLNPELVRWATPPDTPRYALRIPAGRRNSFEEMLERIPPAERITWIRHRTRKGETPASVARRYGVDLKTVLEMNGLRTRHAALKPGRTLLIPPPARSLVAGAPKGRPVQAAVVAVANSRYTVERGDTLWDIARAHDVSIQELQRANELSQDATLMPGQELTIPRPPAGGTSAAIPPREESDRPAPSDTRYVVKRGDTLWDIARSHGVSLDILRRVNNLSRDGNLMPGQELTIPAPAS